MEENIQAEFLLKSISRGMVSATAEYVVPFWAVPFMTVFANNLFNVAKTRKVVYDLEREIRRAIKANDVSTVVYERNFSGGCNTGSQGSNEIDGLLLHLAVPRMLKLVWKFNANDISRTLAEACTRVLNDSAGDRDLRKKRAIALNILGREFYAAITTRQNIYGRNRGMFPNPDQIQAIVKMALMEAVVNENIG